MRLFPVIFLCFLFPFAAPTVAVAQTDNPLAAIAKRLAKGAPTDAAKPDVAAYTFKPTPKRLAVDDLVNTLGSTDEEKTAIRTLLTAGFTAFEEAAKKEGKANDVAAAFTFFIATHYTTATGKPVSDAGGDALYAQVQALFANAEMKATTDADKQRFWESCVGMSVFTLGMGEAMKADADATAGLKKVAAASFETFLSVPVEAVKITDKGIEIAETGGAKAEAGSLSYTVPEGFTEIKAEGGVLLTRTVNSGVDKDLTLKVVLMTGAAQSGKPTDLCQAFYKKYIVPEIPADKVRSNMVIRDTVTDVSRRFVGNGLRCYMTGNYWHQTKGVDYLGTTQEWHVYYIESGATWVPVLVSMTGHDGSDDKGIFRSAGERYDWLEAVLVGLKGTPTGKPLFTLSEVVGDFKSSSGTVGPMMYSVATGGAVGMGAVSSSTQLNIKASGAFTYSFGGALTQAGGGTTFSSEKDTGKVTIENDKWGAFLVRNGKVRTSKDRIVSTFALPDGRRGFVTVSDSDKPTLSFIWNRTERWLTPEK